MRVSALVRLGAAAALAGAARAAIELRFYEGLECRDGAEAVTMTFRQANTVVFDRQSYRTVLASQLEGDRCSWAPHYNGSTAQDRGVRPRAAVYAECRTTFNGAGQSLALHSVEVYDC